LPRGFISNHNALLDFRDQAEFLSPGEAEYAKITSVEREHGFNLVPVCQVHERGIGQLYFQIPVAGNNRSDSTQIHRIERGKLKRFAVK
jgi:hypothetical protein